MLDSSQMNMASAKIYDSVNERQIINFLNELESYNPDFVFNYTTDSLDLYPNCTELLAKKNAKYQSNLTTLCKTNAFERVSLFDNVFENESLMVEHVTYPEIAAQLMSPSNCRPSSPVVQFAKIRAAEDKEGVLRALPNPAPDYGESKIFVSKYVPNKEYLHKNLRNFDNSELLTIFDTPEQRLFELAIGRGLYGTNKDKFADGSEAINSPWRYALFITGAPGIGKSILMSNIQEAAESLQYSVSEFNNLSKQFGLADIISKDFAFSDDLKANTLLNVLTSDSFKSIITGAKIRTEKKFQNEKEIVARSVMIANINHFPSSLLYTLDEGVLNRLKVLQCKKHLAEEDKTYHVINRLCNKYSCSKLELFHAFFRNCVDKYISELECGSLKNTVDKITSELTYRLPIKVHQSFAELLQISYLAQNPEIKIIPTLNGASFRDMIKSLFWFTVAPEAIDARNLFKANWEAKNRSNEHAWIIFRELDIPGLAEAAMLAETISDAQCGNFNGVLKTLLATIRLSDGFKISAIQDTLTAAYDDAKFTLRIKYEPLVEQIEDLKIEAKAVKEPLYYLSAGYSRQLEFEKLTEAKKAADK